MVPPAPPPPAKTASRLPDWTKRCAWCRMGLDRCLCDRLPELVTRTRVVFVVHRSELWKTTNTGILASRCLLRSDVVLAGDPERPMPSTLDTGAGGAWLLYPDESAEEISGIAADEPTTLVVPDGSWRQARKRCLREPALKGLPRVRVPDDVTTRYGLRRPTSDRRLATLEAVAWALTALEGPEVGAALFDVFDEMVRRTWSARGKGPAPPDR